MGGKARGTSGEAGGGTTGVTTVRGATAVVVAAAEGAGTVAVGAAAPKRTLHAMTIEPATASKRAMACGVELVVE